MRRSEAVQLWPEKFVEKVDFNGPLHPALRSRCWLWMAALDRDGYGKFGGGRAHRFAISATGESVDHLCCNRRCVRPDHLEEVSARTNTLRSGGVTALNALKTHCPQGHPYDDKNTYVRDGKRHCRECSRQKDRRLSKTAKHLERKRAYEKSRYATDPAWREKKKERARQTYLKRKGVIP